MPASTREIHDYSTKGNKDVVVRVVRPRNHLGHSFGGDRVKLDAAELQHPAIAQALWTEEEERQAAEEVERRRAAMFREEASPVSRAADAQLARAVEERKKQAEKERRSNPESAE